MKEDVGTNDYMPVSDQAAMDMASARVDAALKQLEISVRSLNGRMRSFARIESETQKLWTDRSRLAVELDRSTAKAQRLDAEAAEVSRKLVDAMETVKSVLSNDRQA